jgi:hypothetical protein
MVLKTQRFLRVFFGQTLKGETQRALLHAAKVKSYAAGLPRIREQAMPAWTDESTRAWAFDWQQRALYDANPGMAKEKIQCVDDLTHFYKEERTSRLTDETAADRGGWATNEPAGFVYWTDCARVKAEVVKTEKIKMATVKIQSMVRRASAQVITKNMKTPESHTRAVNWARRNSQSIIAPPLPLLAASDEDHKEWPGAPAAPAPGE